MGQRFRGSAGVLPAAPRVERSLIVGTLRGGVTRQSVFTQARLSHLLEHAKRRIRFFERGPRSPHPFRRGVAQLRSRLERIRLAPPPGTDGFEHLAGADQVFSRCRCVLGQPAACGIQCGIGLGKRRSEGARYRQL